MKPVIVEAPKPPVKKAKRSKKLQPGTIQNGYCNHGLYQETMRILTAMTGIQWGFVKDNRRVKYVTCSELGYRVAALFGKGYESRIKLQPDITIINKSPGSYQSKEDWVNLLSYELKTELLRVLKTSPQFSPDLKIPLVDLIALINDYPIDMSIEHVMESAQMYTGIDFSNCVVLDAWTNEIEDSDTDWMAREELYWQKNVEPVLNIYDYI
jgi:hypothetical protein